jgi:rhodanese-related sulfurtransferase
MHIQGGVDLPGCRAHRVNELTMTEVTWGRGGRHIAGALLVPLAQLQAAIPAALAGAKDRPIVVYCNDGINSGPEGTQVLNKAGYNGAVNLRNGIEGWEKAGFPIERR